VRRSCPWPPQRAHACAGKDGTEAFEDVGHSDEARALLPAMLVGTLEGTLVRPRRDLQATGGVLIRMRCAGEGEGHGARGREQHRERCAERLVVRPLYRLRGGGC
jgi:cytochrome b involved in lipid metabolism